MRNVLLNAMQWWSRRKLLKHIEDEALDEFLELLLKVVRLTLILDARYRKNIEGFRGGYVFRSHDGAICVSASFADGKMTVHEKEIANPDVVVNFKDGATLCELLLSKNPDLFGFILDNKIDYEGNLNYLLKFGYLARRLQLELAA